MGRDAPNLPPQVSLDSTLKFTTSTPTPFLPHPQPLALRGFGYPCLQTRSKHADANKPPHPPARSFPPPPPEVPLTPRQEWGRDRRKQCRGRASVPGGFSAPGAGAGAGGGGGAASPPAAAAAAAAPAHSAGTHRLHCPPAPPPFRHPSPSTAPSPSPRPSPSRTAPRKVPPAPPRTRAEKCPLPPLLDVPPGGEGNCPSPHLSAGPSRREGPALQRECHLSPSRTRIMVPTRPLPPPPPSLPRRHRPRAPAHRGARLLDPRPSLQYFTMEPPTVGTTSCFAWTRPQVPSSVRHPARGDAYSPP